MLQRSHSSVGRQGVQEIDLKELLGIREQAVKVVQVLRREAFTQNTSVPELPG